MVVVDGNRYMHQNTVAVVDGNRYPHQINVVVVDGNIYPHKNTVVIVNVKHKLNGCLICMCVCML